MGLRTGRVSLVCLALAAATVASSTVSGAVPAGDLTADDAAGEWRGIAVADGSVSSEDAQILVSWSGAIIASFMFTVASGGSVDGTWTLAGKGVQLVSLKVGQPFDAIGELDYGGGGTMSGGGESLVLNGNARTTGVVDLPEGTIAGPAAALFPLPIDNTNPLPQLVVEVDLICDELYGDWGFTVGDAFSDAGFSPAAGPLGLGIDGNLVAFKGRAGLSEYALSLFADQGFNLDSSSYVNEDAAIDGVTGVLDGLAALNQEVSAMLTSFPNWSADEVRDTIRRVHAVLNELRNLSECQKRLLGEDNVEYFTNVFTGVVRRLIFGLVELNIFPGGLQSFAPPPPGEGELTASAYQQLTYLAVESAAIGAGAEDLEVAALAEQVLIDTGSRILQAHADAAGSLPANAEVATVMSVGAMMGWTFVVNGENIDARADFAGLAS